MLINLTCIYKQSILVIRYFLIACTVRLSGALSLSALPPYFGVWMEIAHDPSPKGHQPCTPRCGTRQECDGIPRRCRVPENPWACALHHLWEMPRDGIPLRKANATDWAGKKRRTRRNLGWKGPWGSPEGPFQGQSMILGTLQVPHAWGSSTCGWRSGCAEYKYR